MYTSEDFKGTNSLSGPKSLTFVSLLNSYYITYNAVVLVYRIMGHQIN